jgi:hypothetical protein
MRVLTSDATRSIRGFGLIALCATTLFVAAIAGCDKKPEGGGTGTATSKSTTSAPSGSASTSAAGSSSAAAPGGADLEAACDAVAKARCAKLESCNKTTFALQEGTLAGCTTRTKNVCLYERAPKESGLTVDNLKECAKAQEAATCEHALAGHLKGCERANGKLAAGKSCAFDAQCESQFCTREVGSSCGKCDAAPKEGEACKQDRCGHGGFACIDKKCAKKKAKDEACKGTGQAGCDGNMVCLGGKCVAPGKAGDKCDASGKTTGDCDPFEGLYCDKTEKKCKAYKIANVGDGCGEKDVGVACPASSSCEQDKCVAMLAVGAACKENEGAICDAPSVCISGKCTIPDSTICKD